MTDVRPMRVDAQRNRDRLVVEAAAAFGERGVDVPLEEIARRADVGIGTVYRHFPTRDALVEAVYRREIENLCDSADELLATRAGEQALEEWLVRFVDYSAAKRGMSEALKGVVAKDSELFADSHRRISQAVGALVVAGVDTGAIRGDVDPLDLLRAVSGICQAQGSVDTAEWQERAKRIVALLMDGLRFRA